MEQQTKKALAGLEILNTNLKKYEMENEESASLSQVSCCQKNLQHSLQEIRERKHWSSNSSPINRIFAIPGMVMVYETGYINLEEFHQVLLVHPAALLVTLPFTDSEALF
ncbi:hypothetical protein V6N13_111274 [Hibiscus sabdariffa]